MTPRRTSIEPFIRKVLVRQPEDPQAFPFCLPAVSALSGLVPHPSVTFFVGENGSGKSTVLEGIAEAAGLNPEGGSRNFNFATRASHSNLGEFLTLVRGPARPKDGYFLRAESFYNVATEIDRIDEDKTLIHSYGGVSLHQRSHGESFLALFVHRFGAGGLYLLDEPESALSPSRQLSFLARLHELVGLGCQFLIATHSPIILAYPNAKILEFSSGGIVERAYDELEHVRVTRDFLASPERVLRHLMMP